MGCGASSGKCGCSGAAAASGGGLLKFSGVTTNATGGPTTQYLADQGFAGGASLTAPLTYPVPVKRTFTGLAARLVALPPTDATVVVTLLKNGVATALTKTFTSVSDLLLFASGSVVFEKGDTFDVRVVVTNPGDTTVFNVDVVIGTK